MDDHSGAEDQLTQWADRNLGSELTALVLEEAKASPDPLRGIRNLLRWVESPGASESRIALLSQNPGFLHRLVQTVAASQAIADSFFQNPELALLLADREELEKPLRRADIEAMGHNLLEAARSYAHRLDRLRYLKQQCLVRIVWNDLSTTWNPDAVWLALSDLADAVIRLALGVISNETGVDGNDLVILAMGKLGSRELNYSSDVDLICLVKDDAANLEPYQKVAEMLGSALMGRMGRGFLYRVDYRLRPFGAAGAIVHRISAARNYYERYAEPPELLALVRCRTCAGSVEAGYSFLSQLHENIYRPVRSEMFLSSLLETKARYEERVRAEGLEEADLKQGPGGIRDVEFLVNMYQMMEGHDTPAVRSASTLDAIRELAAIGRLSGAESDTLRTSYILLRQAEHRIQLRHNLQSHQLPENAEEREALAHLLGYRSWRDASQALRSRRRQVRTIVEQHIPLRHTARISFDSLCSQLHYASGSAEQKALEKVVGFYEDADALVRAAMAEQTLLDRLKLIVEGAPRFVPDITFHPELWDVAFSAEPEMAWSDFEEVLSLLLQRNTDETLELDLARRVRHGWVTVALRDAYHRRVGETAESLTRIAEWALLAVLDELGAREIDVIAYGRLGSRELTLASDWDIAFIHTGSAPMEAAHHWVEEALRAYRRMQVQGLRLPIDMRLRPEGSAGAVVRSLEAFQRYAYTSMETWERLALTRARSLRGVPQVEAVIAEAIETTRRQQNWLQDILAMRLRVQEERTSSSSRERNVKLSSGFLIDIEWLLGMLEIELGERKRSVLRQKLVDFEAEGVLRNQEANELTAALDLFDAIRNAAYRLDLPSAEEIPEAGSDSFERLARAVGFTPSELLQQVDAARAHVQAAWDRRYGA